MRTTYVFAEFSHSFLFRVISVLQQHHTQTIAYDMHTVGDCRESFSRCNVCPTFGVLARELIDALLRQSCLPCLLMDNIVHSSVVDEQQHRAVRTRTNTEVHCSCEAKATHQLVRCQAIATTIRRQKHFSPLLSHHMLTACTALVYHPLTTIAFT